MHLAMALLVPANAFGLARPAFRILAYRKTICLFGNAGFWFWSVPEYTDSEET